MDGGIGATGGEGNQGESDVGEPAHVSTGVVSTVAADADMGRGQGIAAMAPPREEKDVGQREKMERIPDTEEGVGEAGGRRSE